MDDRFIKFRTFKNFKWTDFQNPERSGLDEIASKYQLDFHQIKDSLEPGHLPKFEKESNYQFLILRAFTSTNNQVASTITEFSNKIAFFYNEKKLITIHRSSFDFIENCDASFEQVEDLLLHLIHKMLNSYQPPLNEFDKRIEEFEKTIFLKNEDKVSMEDLYYLKMQTRITKKLLIIFQNVMHQLEVGQKNKSALQDLKDRLVQLILKYDEVLENANNLLNTWHSVNTKKTNDTIKLLTVFSAFFLPLTFIVGIYGMNFKYMPELEWKYGYFMALAMMVSLAIFIFIWFKKSKII
jgi:magnesium transporter